MVFYLLSFSALDASDIVAFCAYMSTTEVSPTRHHVLVFDDVKTNIGSAFNRISGMFTAPIDGAYVFTWTIFSDRHSDSYINSQIVVNTEAFTSMITDSDEVGDFHSSTGVIVLNLNRVDSVYIRTHPTDNNKNCPMETFLAEVFVDAHRLVGGNCELMHECTWE